MALLIKNGVVASSPSLETLETCFFHHFTGGHCWNLSVRLQNGEKSKGLGVDMHATLIMKEETGLPLSSCKMLI